MSDTELINEIINELINDKGDFRTSPATPGLLDIDAKYLGHAYIFSSSSYYSL